MVHSFFWLEVDMHAFLSIQGITYKFISIQLLNCFPMESFVLVLAFSRLHL